MRQRIEWVDTLKALAIMCVVFGHVEYFSMHGYHGFFNRWQDTFCMPLFFFLSGLFAKSQMSVIDGWKCMKRKFVLLMVPFVCCGLLYTYVCCPSRPVWSLFWYPGGGAHNGYWFLWVLFVMYFLFTIGQQIVHIIRPYPPKKNVGFTC